MQIGGIRILGIPPGQEFALSHHTTTCAFIWTQIRDSPWSDINGWGIVRPPHRGAWSKSVLTESVPSSNRIVMSPVLSPRPHRACRSKFEQ